MSIFKRIINIILTNDRHRRYEQQIKMASIKKEPDSMLGTNMKGRRQ